MHRLSFHRALLFIFSFATIAAAAPVDALSVKASCKTITPINIVIFFVTNYISHAMTVPSTAGMMKSLLLLYRYAKCHDTDLEKTLARGAILFVKRSQSWEPQADKEEEVCIRVNKGLSYLSKEEFFQFDQESEIIQDAHIEIRDRKYDYQERRMWHPALLALYRGDADTQPDTKHLDIHGSLPVRDLPPGYELAFADLRDQRHLDLSGDTTITCNKTSWIKVVISIAQIMFASFTLYQAAENQVDVFGYAAYGLSVIPYLMQSVVNLFTGYFTGEYPCAFVIKTSILAEAIGRMGPEKAKKFSGEVGTPKEPKDTELAEYSFMVKMKAVREEGVKRVVITDPMDARNSISVLNVDKWV
ncbi:hypothetical protein CONPUDRAFT_74074 [Coniophora puteana RWD-64-598 SS2]|uniref:Uncharacterized protein n=1 Tax=Coniophora puteana (strain RWD-64-598) TaxID=741705 RepID=A0A5M3MKV1_CONPW|nr:uncharacterized protein CONPUDRAFT_74074 [Coniophora puteana RWD-64-598 SS2]EIW79713.1 hypothetical protein CONPUDRAFT_74074 [Coniophora puteana RWD-64-598 SS2]